MFRHAVDFLEALIPLDTEAIVFCKQILTRIFWEALWCYRFVPEMLPAHELECNQLSKFEKFCYIVFPIIFHPFFFYEALNDSRS